LILRKLIADQKERLGMNGVEEIKAHPFFAGINWNRLRFPFCYVEKGNHPTSLKLRTHGILRTLIPMRNRSPGSHQKSKMSEAARRTQSSLDTLTSLQKITTRL
jgi:hypothetical protein